MTTPSETRIAALDAAIRALCGGADTPPPEEIARYATVFEGYLMHGGGSAPVLTLLPTVYDLSGALRPEDRG